MNKKTIILSGAGAVVPWGAPSTKEITEEIISDNLFISDTGQTIGEWIYHKLLGFYHQDKDLVTFETILNAIEYLNTFFLSKEKAGGTSNKNLMPAFLNIKDDIWEILWFDKIYKKESGLWTAGDERTSPLFWYDNASFFLTVFRHFINKIASKIEAYSKKSGDNPVLNNLFNEFLQSQGGIIRFYTTNYDRIIPAIFKLKLFEGFTQNKDGWKFNLAKVLNDKNINTYYNLHGSVHYKLDFPDNVMFDPNEYFSDFGSGASNKNDQDGKEIINSNIITGFNKSSRILTNPYSQFYHRFYEDCLTADKIFIIGYSFGDIHLNTAIKTASFAKKDLKIVCIDYMVYNDKSINKETLSDWIYANQNKNFLDPNYKHRLGQILNPFDALDPNNSDRIKIYRKGFQQFLEHKQWTKEPPLK
jgi:hypothetical protein